jgi:benzoyl-CoA reductase/2-hydroxyglutaryl-CoA dehydratase subunit BcrC/BadD/HgdB
MTKGLLIFTTLILAGCYSFKGVVVPPEVDTFYVENFTLRIGTSPAAIEVVIAEELRKKIREGSRLRANDTEPDVEFSGVITRYGVEFAGATAGDEAALNKLTMSVNIEYIDNIDDERSFKKDYSQFTTFDASVDLQDVEDGLITTLVDEITEQIFNDTYTDW